MKTITLTQGQVTLVDDEDYLALSKFVWLPSKAKDTCYAKRLERSKKATRTFWMHRVILGLSSEDPREVDHKDRDGLNNQRSNLRAVSHCQNEWNRRNTKGYYVDGATNRAQIVANGKTVRLGRFRTEFEARLVYLFAKGRLHVMPGCESHNFLTVGPEG
jgi:hypothetical protein